MHKVDLFINLFRNGSVWIQPYFYQEEFTEKIYSRAYSLDDLIGTCGGYIGLFLGYAIIQVPQLIENMFQALKQKISTRNSHETVRNMEMGELSQ